MIPALYLIVGILVSVAFRLYMKERTPLLVLTMAAIAWPFVVVIALVHFLMDTKV